MRLSGSEFVTISLLFLLISVAAAQYQYYDDDEVSQGSQGSPGRKIKSPDEFSILNSIQS